jgi:L-rhamnose isomerase
VRWDSDHVVTWDDELQNIMNEIVLNDYTERVHIGLDYFDASINRLACWVIGSRNVRKALLKAALTPIAAMRSAETTGDYTSRLALIEENKSLPFAPIWDYYCLVSGAPVGASWLEGIKQYERSVLAIR